MGSSGISIISLISALTALVASIVSPFVTLNTAKRQINASVISTNRTRWIDTLRDQLAILIAQLTAVRILLVGQANCEAAAHNDQRQYVDRIQQIAQTTAKIRLMLNMHEADHIQLAETIQDTVQYLRHSVEAESIEQHVDQATDTMIRIGQEISKREWIRVKKGN